MARKKKPISAQSRRDLAIRHGCNPGEVVTVFCRCGKDGRVAWIISGRQKHGWVTFPGMEIDHVVPEFLGGTGTSDNLQLLCTQCNRRKGYRDGSN